MVKKVKNIMLLTNLKVVLKLIEDQINDLIFKIVTTTCCIKKYEFLVCLVMSHTFELVI